MKLHGMKKVCQESRYAGQFPIYIWVNRRTGEVFGYIDSVEPSNDWIDKDIRFVCSRREYMTMAEIREECECAIRESYWWDEEVERMRKHCEEEDAKFMAECVKEKERILKHLEEENKKAKAEYEEGNRCFLAKQAKA